MTGICFKSLSMIVPGGRGLLFGGLLLMAQPGGESYSAQPLTLDAARVVSQDSRRSDPLESNQPIERKLAGGESHFYEVTLASEQFLRLAVDQRGIDVALTLFDPNGSRIAEFNNRQGERGVEAASLVANQPGAYRIEVRSIRQSDPLGSYQIKLETLHPAADRDRAISAVEYLVARATALQAEPTKESLLQSMKGFQEALPLLAAAGDLQLKAVVLNQLGICHYFLGEYQKALTYHHQALLLIRAAADHDEEASTLTDLGNAYRLKSENDQALDYLNQALEMWRLNQDRRGEWRALVAVARLYSLMGEGYKALSCFDQALQISRVLSDRGQQLNTLSGMGGTYYVLGENEKAVAAWKEALVLAKAGGQPGMEMLLLGKLGAAYNALSDHQQALDYLDQAIRLARDRNDRIDEAGSLQTIGRVYRSMGEPKKAIEYLDQSLVVLKDVNNPPISVARSHYNLGKVYTDIGEYQKALDYLNQALLVWKARGDPINIAATIRELARAERGRGNLETALAQSETALNLMEWLRSRAGGPELRASYQALVQDCFELRIDVLMQLHKLNPSRNYDAAALQTSEKARARSLLETLAEAGLDLRRGVNPDLLKREQAITEELSAKATEQARLAGTKSAEQFLTEVGKDIKDLSAQYEIVAERIRAASPRYAELTQPQPLSLAQIREQVIDGQTLLLEYYLGSERSYLWAVTSTSIESYELRSAK